MAATGRPTVLCDHHDPARACGTQPRSLQSKDSPQRKRMAMERFASKVPGIKSASPDLTVVAPFDRKPIGTVATADAATVEHALATAHKLYRDRDVWLPLAKRIEILEGGASLLKARAEYLAVEAAR